MLVASRARRRKGECLTAVIIIGVLMLCVLVSSCQQNAQQNAPIEAQRANEIAQAEAARAKQAAEQARIEKEQAAAEARKEAERAAAQARIEEERAKEQTQMEAAQSFPRAEAEINDEKAVMPLWYRARLCIQTAGDPPVASVSLTPFLRMMAFDLVAFPLLIIAALNPFSVRFQNFIGVKERPLAERLGTGLGLTLASTIVAFAVPFVLALPLNGGFRILSYACVGEHYYIPWHFIVFCLDGLLVTALAVVTLARLAKVISAAWPTPSNPPDPEFADIWAKHGHRRTTKSTGR